MSHCHYQPLQLNFQNQQHQQQRRQYSVHCVENQICKANAPIEGVVDLQHLISLNLRARKKRRGAKFAYIVFPQNESIAELLCALASCRK